MFLDRYSARSQSLTERIITELRPPTLQSKFINFPKHNLNFLGNYAKTHPLVISVMLSISLEFAFSPSTVADVQMLDGPGRDGFSHRQENGDSGRLCTQVRVHRHVNIRINPSK